MQDIVIRKAQFEDAAEIANVHINSWREAYQGLLPQEFLDDRPLFFKNRYELWKKVTKNEKQFTFVAESRDDGIVGFVNGSDARDEGYSDYSELWCLYLLKRYQGKQIGFHLLKEYFDLEQQRGLQKGYCWVLENNPSIKFYERTNATFKNVTREDEIAGKKVKELMYVWDDIGLKL